MVIGHNTSHIQLITICVRAVALKAQRKKEDHHQFDNIYGIFVCNYAANSVRMYFYLLRLLHDF